MAVIARGFSLAIGVLFLLGLSHKLKLLSRGAAREEPLLQTRKIFAEHARLVLAGAAVMECATVALLIGDPLVGLAVATVVLLAYTNQIRHLRPDQSCHCFGEVVQTGSRASGLARNMALIVACLLSEGVYATGAVDVGPITPEVLGAVALILSAPLAIETLRWDTERRSTNYGAS